jgi:RNA polymerase sigma-70 factor (ECF subfamily)
MQPTDRTHASLLSRLRNPDDADAWQQFDRTYRDLILRYCHRKGLQHWDAEDVRQTVLLRISSVLKSGFRYEPRLGKFRSYLGRVVVNTIVAFLRRPNPLPGAVEEWVDDQVSQPFAPGQGEDTDAEWEEEWRYHHLRLAMAQLEDHVDPRNLEIFQRLLRGESTADVAERFAMTRQAVHKVKQRFRDRLRILIAEQIRDEDGIES